MTTKSWRHYISRPLSLGLVVGLCSLATAGASAASTWTVNQLDNSADVGRYPSIAADANRKLHISYLDAAGTLKYASDKSGSWSVGAISSVPATKVILASTALALDAGNNPHVNYYFYQTVNNRGMRNVVFNGSSWGTPSPLNGSYTPDPDQASAIFHRGGFSHLAFVKNVGSNSALYYVRNSTAGDYGNWGTIVQIDAVENSGANNSIVVDSQGKAHVVGYNSASTDLFYYTNQSGAWVKSTLVASAPNAVGRYCSLAVDGSDNLHLTYLESTSSPASYRIKYQFKPAGGAWQSAVDLADAGQFGGFPSIKTDVNGSVHISYYHSASSGSGSLRYATNLSGAWNDELVDASSSDLGKYSSITVDSSRTVSIAYYDVTNSALKLASTQITAVATISLSAASLDFGSVGRWVSSALPVVVSNTGQAALNISSISLSGAAASQFSASSCGSIPVGGNCTVTVTLTPNNGGLKSASLAIASNDPATPSASVSLSGSSPWLISAQVGHGGSGGSITPAGQVSVAPGQNQSFTIASAGAPFSLADVLVDSVSVGTQASYTFNNVSADHSIESLFVSPIRLVGIPFIYYASLQAAYDAMVDSGTMQTLSVVPAAEALVVDQPVTATIKGGYEAGFSSQSGSTMLNSITISDGNLTPDGLVLQ